jgi:hypothetical protein
MTSTPKSEEVAPVQVTPRAEGVQNRTVELETTAIPNRDAVRLCRYEELAERENRLRAVSRSVDTPE